MSDTAEAAKRRTRAALAQSDAVRLQRDLRALAYAKGEVSSVRSGRDTFMKKSNLYFRAPKDTVALDVAARTKAAEKQLAAAKAVVAALHGPTS